MIMSMSEYELSLVMEARKGKKKSFDRLYDALHKTLCEVIEREIGDRSRAETILRAVFDRLKVQVKSVTDPAQFEQMAIQETVNECKSYPRVDKPAESGATQFTTYEGKNKKEKEEPKPEPKPEPRYDAGRDSRYDARSDSRYDSGRDSRYDARQDSRYESRPEPAYDARKDSRYESRPEPSYDARQDSRYESRPEPAYDARQDSRYESRPEPAYDARQEPRYEPRPEPKPEPRPEPRPQPRPEPKRDYGSRSTRSAHNAIEDISPEPQRNEAPARQQPQRSDQRFAQSFSGRPAQQRQSQPPEPPQRPGSPQRSDQRFAKTFSGRPAPQPAQKNAQQFAQKPPVQPRKPDRPSGPKVNNSVDEPVMGWLVCVNGFDRGRNYTIKDKTNVIGSSQNNDIRIHREPAVMADNHASIVYNKQKNECTLQIGPGAKVRLNGKYLDHPQVLKKFDVITIGNAQLVYAPYSEGLSWKRNFGL